jgi:hypothetical protein
MILWTTKMTHHVLMPRDSKTFEGAVRLRHFHGFGDAPLRNLFGRQHERYW